MFIKTDHLWWTDERWKRVCFVFNFNYTVPTIDKLFKNKNLILYPALPNKLREISIGVLLGDASIQKNTSKTQEKYRLKFLQGAKHKDYVFHLHNQFKDYVLSAPYFDCNRNTCSFQTLFHPHFNQLADIFLDANGNKSISVLFKKNTISPTSLAYLFMDDGGRLCYNTDYVRKGLVLNTQGFAVDQVKVLSENLNNAYNLKSWVKQNKKKAIIAFSGKEYVQIKNLILPHLLDSMKYKLPNTK